MNYYAWITTLPCDGGWTETKTVIVIFKAVSPTERQKYNCHYSFFLYLTLFLIVRHSIFDQSPKFCKNFTYKWLEFKIKHLVIIHKKNRRMGRNIFLDVVIRMKSYSLCLNFAWKLAHKWVMNRLSNKRKDISGHIISQKDQQF